MIDKDIKKTLEQHIRIANYVDSDYCDSVSVDLLQRTIDFVNYQQSEIKRLRNNAYNRVTSRVVTLPCSIGDKIYCIDEILDENDNEHLVISHVICTSITVDADGFSMYCCYGEGVWYWHKFGQTAFVTLEEAEEVLKGR